MVTQTANDTPRQPNVHIGVHFGGKTAQIRKTPFGLTRWCSFLDGADQSTRQVRLAISAMDLSPLRTSAARVDLFKLRTKALTCFATLPRQ